MKKIMRQYYRKQSPEKGQPAVAVALMGVLKASLKVALRNLWSELWV